MSKRIRRAVISGGPSVSGLANLEWNDAHDFDRSQGDDEMSGTPIEMARKGAGTLTLLEGYVATGYGTADLVGTYKEIELVDGVESEVEKTVTFTDPTYNAGGSVPAEGKGEIRCAFDYSTCTQS